MLCLWLASVLSLFQLAVGAIVNSTVDDTNGGPNGNTILYGNGWQQGGIGNCNNCPPPPISISDLAYMNTFHGSVFNQRNKGNTNQNPPTATLVFFGSSVSVNCILSNALSIPAGTSDMTFNIDGIQRGTFSHSPSGNPGFQASTVFISEPLQPGNHTLVIQNGRPGEGSSLVFLDSITYSFDDSSTPSSTFIEPSASPTSAGSASAIGGAAKRSNTAAIAGGVIAALAVILLIALAFLYIRYRRNQHRSNVPLSTSIYSPIGRIGRLWSAVQSPPKPPPDMAPVPFPSPAHHISHPPSPRPPAPAPAAPAPPGSRLSRISFNANLLVGRFQRRPPPPAILTRHAPGTPPNTRQSVPPSPAPPSGNPLLRPPSAQPEPNNVVASIQQWQRRTQEETANEPIPIIHPLDMSEVDLSSHYDESSISSPPPPPPAPPPRSPQPPPRRFTVMNN